jgi:hypothetical protein
MSHLAERRLAVTVWAEGVKPRCYVVSATTQGEATTKAKARFLEHHARLSGADLEVRVDHHA